MIQISPRICKGLNCKSGQQSLATFNEKSANIFQLNLINVYRCPIEYQTYGRQ
jgi:hypothetical protein